MSEWITLTCPSCGGKLQVTTSMERFACANCGNEHIVNRQGGAIYLTPVIETLQNLQAGTDKTASELAIARLKTEIEEIEKAKKGIKEAISYAFNDPFKFKEVKYALARRRKSPFDKINFQKSASPNSCIREIQSMTSDEFEHIKSNVTLNMIWFNLQTLENFENLLQKKRAQISRHIKIVDGK